ncbi:MAG: lantibiotic ABC transporter permease [Streptococcaceae bacterium]|nr:lantibiotic ABC transporter permease [Streptococcaceae bacterium]
MKNILKSEYIKVRGFNRIRMVIVLPIVTVFIALVMSSPTILVSFSLYWWEAMFLFLLMSLLFLFDFNSELRAGKFQNIDIKKYRMKIQVSKILWMLLQSLLASIILIVVLWLVSLIFPEIVVINFAKLALTLLLMLFAVLWNLPVLYFLSRWVSPYVLLAGNVLISLLVAPLVAQTNFWFVLPWTYQYIIGKNVMQIKPSGDVISGVVTPNITNIVIAIGLSVVLSIMFSYLQKRGEN